MAEGLSLCWRLRFVTVVGRFVTVLAVRFVTVLATNAVHPKHVVSYGSLGDSSSSHKVL